MDSSTKKYPRQDNPENTAVEILAKKALFSSKKALRVGTRSET